MSTFLKVSDKIRSFIIRCACLHKPIRAVEGENGRDKIVVWENRKVKVSLPVDTCEQGAMVKTEL